MKFKFDPSIGVSWGVYRCECGSEYFHEKTPVHNPGCEEAGREGGNGNISYCFGIREVDSVLQASNGRSRCGMLTREILEDGIGEWPEEVRERMRSL